MNVAFDTFAHVQHFHVGIFEAFFLFFKKYFFKNKMK